MPPHSLFVFLLVLLRHGPPRRPLPSGGGLLLPGPLSAASPAAVPRPDRSGTRALPNPELSVEGIQSGPALPEAPKASVGVQQQIEVKPPSLPHPTDQTKPATRETYVEIPHIGFQ